MYEKLYELKAMPFACSKFVFDRIGGFDESFEGYGGEDTDLRFQQELQELISEASLNNSLPSVSCQLRFAD